jgi:hypothetical protein
MPPPGLSPASVLVSAFWQLLRALRPALDGRAAGLAAFPAGAMFLQVGNNHNLQETHACSRGVCMRGPLVSWGWGTTMGDHLSPMGDHSCAEKTPIVGVTK